MIWKDVQCCLTVHDRAPKVHTTLVLVPKSICHDTKGAFVNLKEKKCDGTDWSKLSNFGLSD